MVVQELVVGTALTIEPFLFDPRPAGNYKKKFIAG